MLPLVMSCGNGGSNTSQDYLSRSVSCYSTPDRDAFGVAIKLDRDNKTYTLYESSFRSQGWSATKKGRYSEVIDEGIVECDLNIEPQRLGDVYKVIVSVKPDIATFVSISSQLDASLCNLSELSSEKDWSSHMEECFFGDELDFIEKKYGSYVRDPEEDEKENLELSRSFSGKVVVRNDNGRCEGRYVLERERAYCVVAQDIGYVSKAEAHVELWKAEDGKGWVWSEESDKKFNVHEKPNKKSKVVAIICNDPYDLPETYPCLGLSNGWFKICIDGKVGYIQTSSVKYDTIDTI